MEWRVVFVLREPVWRIFVCADGVRRERGLVVRRICPGWGRVVSCVMKEMAQVVFPPDVRGLVETERLVGTPMGKPVEG